MLFRSTVKPFQGLGTLKPGSIADITILDIEQGNFPLVDNYKNERVVKQRLVKRKVIVAGSVVG